MFSNTLTPTSELVESGTEDALWAYTEPSDHQQVKQNPETIFPVLFIHGHAGNWQQAKHLAQVMAIQHNKGSKKVLNMICAVIWITMLYLMISLVGSFFCRLC